MAVILPTDTIGQTWFPYLVSLLHEHFGGYAVALNSVILVAAVGAISIMLLPSKEAVEHNDNDETLPLQNAKRTAAKR